MIAASPQWIGASEPTAASSVRGKDPRLIVHTARPAVLETPPELLVAGRITPVPRLFVRNNQQPTDAATLEPAKLEGWKIELAGLIDQPQTFDAAATLGALDQVEYEMVLQCSGNSRALFTAAAPVKGTLWGRGAMGNVKFAGVPLAKLLDHLGVRPQEGAKFLTADGSDAPEAGQQDFEHSLPLDEALKKSFLALRLNGQPLPAIHGGPVRLVTPGYYGTMHIKWLSQLRFTPGESDHTSQIPHYRTPRQPIKPGQPYDFTYANSDPNWRMKIKSVVLSPAPAARLARRDRRPGRGLQRRRVADRVGARLHRRRPHLASRRPGRSRQPLRLVRLAHQGQAGLRQPPDLGPSLRPPGPQPADRRRVGVEPLGLHVQRDGKDRSDRGVRLW